MSEEFYDPQERCVVSLSAVESVVVLETLPAWSVQGLQAPITEMCLLPSLLFLR